MKKKVYFLVLAAVVLFLFNEQTLIRRPDREEARAVGAPKITVSADNALVEINPDREYISIFVESTKPITITGWTIENSRGERFQISRVAENFEQGKVNELSPTEVSSQDIIFLISGESPLGVSFRENECTEILERYQKIIPSPPHILTYPDYPSCVEALKDKADFKKNVWYVYLGADHELWFTPTPTRWWERGPLERVKIYDAAGKLVYFSFIFDLKQLH